MFQTFWDWHLQVCPGNRWNNGINGNKWKKSLVINGKNGNKYSQIANCNKWCNKSVINDLNGKKGKFNKR